jgi:hypothetical protein
MDNFFELLFILFLIFSFLAPLFKKKTESDKPVRKEEPPDNNYQTDSQAANTYEEKGQEDYDILREIEGMFNKNTELKTPVEKETTVMQQASEADENEGLVTPEEKNLQKEEHTEQTEWHRLTDKTDYSREDALLQEEAERFEKYLNPNKETNIVKQNILATIKNPESLKEYFVISEILGKPKGFEF